MENKELNDQVVNVQPNYIYNCELCDYHTNVKMNWALHELTEKHKRNGQKKPISCDKCNYVGLNHWNLKLHILTQHSTIEERKKAKYYCETCDQVFFC